MSIRIAAVLLLLSAPATAHSQTKASFVYQGAQVRAKVPTLGKGWFYGSYAHARSAIGDCPGVGLTIPKMGKNPIMVLVSGVSELEVDRRTNANILTIGLTPPADSDWQVVDLKELAKANPACVVK